MLTANYGNLSIISMGALKALNSKVESLEKENEELRSRLKRLEDMILESEAMNDGD